MDRPIVYPGAIPLDSDVLSTNRYAMISDGWLAHALTNGATALDGLAAGPTAPASMSITVSAGAIFQNSVVDATPYGSLAADTVDALFKIGINLAATTLGPFTAPGTAGQSQNFLVQGALSETDTNATVLPYYNASNPALPYAGPSNTGQAQNTLRRQTVNLQIKAGSPATTGSQTTPGADAGFVGLAVVTVANGQTSIVSGNIVTLPGAPYIRRINGFSNIQAFTSSGSFTIPSGYTRIKARVWGAGGGGGGVNGVAQSSGAGGGGYAEGVYTVVSGAVYTITIGAGGAGGPGTGANGAAGGTSSVGALVSASGGLGGIGSTSGGAATVTAGGVGTSGQVNLSGSTGSGGNASTFGGSGGASPFGIAGAPVGSNNGTGAAGMAPGGGGGGTACSTGGQAGGAGGPGLVIIEW